MNRSSEINIHRTANIENGGSIPDAIPEVIESYRDYEPPAQIRKMVDNLLSYVPPKYLVGLKTIVLTNRSALTRDKRRQKIWSRGRKYCLAESLGSYSRAWKSSPAIVWLYVDNIVSPDPAWVLRTPLCVTRGWRMFCTTKSVTTFTQCTDLFTKVRKM